MNDERACRCVCHLTDEVTALKESGVPHAGLTRTELRVLAALLPVGSVNRTRVIEHRVWDDAVDDHAVRVNVSRIRPKLTRQGWAIRSRPGVGYSLERAS